MVFLLDRILEKAVSLGMLSPTSIRMLTVSEAAGIDFQAAGEISTSEDGTDARTTSGSVAG